LRWRKPRRSPWRCGSVGERDRPNLASSNESVQTAATPSGGGG
jgi:hypothetical protein